MERLLIMYVDPPVDSPLYGALCCVDDAEHDGVHEPVFDGLSVIVPDCLVGRVCWIDEARCDAAMYSESVSALQADTADKGGVRSRVAPD